jgi:O-methyltransferase involved in polyketide biosynthesis
VNFERQSFIEELTRAGYDPGRPAWYSWLGVTPYLERPVVMTTLRQIAAVAGAGGGVAFDYGVDSSGLTWLQRAARADVSARVSRAGEPFKTFFDPPTLDADLRAIGLADVDDLDGRALNGRYFADRSDALKVGSLSRVVVARVSS